MAKLFAILFPWLKESPVQPKRIEKPAEIRKRARRKNRHKSKQELREQNYSQE